MQKKILIAILAVVLSANAGAQSFQGIVRGTVRDSDGVIPGADVALINQGNGVTRETTTNGVGDYSFPAVEPARYTLRIQLTGFKTYENKNLVVATQAQLDIPVQLEIGILEEAISVTASAPLIEVSSATQGTTLTIENFRQLPSEGRSVLAMATLEPTVVASGNAHYNRMQDQSGMSSLSMGGGAVRSNNFLIDGFPTTDMQNRSSVNPSLEALEDARVQIHTYDAEMGRTGGGVMNMTARSGGNRLEGSGYTVFRPESLQSQLIIPKVNHEVFMPESWRNGGGGVGGPIVKNRTFFWLAGEKYIDNQPQAGAIAVPSMASRAGDFSQVTRSGKAVTIIDPLTGVAFPGNVIPASRLNFTGSTIASYLPAPNRDVDDGAQNLSMTAILPSHAYQWTGKVTHNFTNTVSSSLFYLRQVTGENSANFNTQNPVAGTQFYLERADHTVVANNTWVMNPSTVLTVRGGWNEFKDGNKLPLAFNAAALWPGNTAYTSQFTDSNRFPTTSMTGYSGTGWSNRSDNVYYQYGVNGTLSKLAGVHNVKVGGDFRTLGVRSSTFGASTGSYSFDGRFTGNALADMLLGYPSGGSIPITANLDGYVHYTAAFLQDDWRVSRRLTLNYGVRLEHETNLQERENRITTDFAMNTISPLNDLVNVIDPITGQRRTIYGGLLYAGQNGAPTQQGGTRSPQISPRVGAVYKITDKTVVRGGWGIYVAPWNYSSAGTSTWSQYGYAATTDLQQSSGGVPITSLSDPFPNGLVQPTGQSLGLLTNTGANTTVNLPGKGTPKAQQYSVDLQRQLPGGVMVGIGYTGLTGSELDWQSTIELNALDPSVRTSGVNTLANVANPFYGVAAAGQFSTRTTVQLGQLLRPYPQFGNVTWSGATGAHSQYHALVLQGRKRVGNVWGMNVAYTYSNLKDNQVGQGNYYSRSSPVQNEYMLVPTSVYYNPDSEYGTSLLNSPHKLTVSPTILLPFGKGKAFLSQSALANALLGGWSLTSVLQVQSGFPLGVSQNITGGLFLFGGAIRPNVVADQPLLATGDITQRIETSTTDNQYFNLAAFQTVDQKVQYGNAPRILPDVLSPRRIDYSMSATKNVDLPSGANVDLRVELLNPFNIVQWAAPASTAVGNASFGQIRTQANNMRSVQFTVRVSY